MHTVLVVEDDSMVRTPIAEYLRVSGYIVLEAGSASEAIATLETGAPVGLVFSDVRMPGKMDGLGLAEWCHAHYPALPVLLASGYTSRPLTVSFPQDTIIQKPYLPSQIGRRIAELFEGRMA